MWVLGQNVVRPGNWWFQVSRGEKSGISLVEVEKLKSPTRSSLDLHQTPDHQSRQRLGRCVVVVGSTSRQRCNVEGQLRLAWYRLKIPRQDGHFDENRLISERWAFSPMTAVKYARHFGSR